MHKSINRILDLPSSFCFLKHELLFTMIDSLILTDPKSLVESKLSVLKLSILGLFGSCFLKQKQR